MATLLSFFHSHRLLFAYKDSNKLFNQLAACLLMKHKLPVNLSLNHLTSSTDNRPTLKDSRDSPTSDAPPAADVSSASTGLLDSEKLKQLKEDTLKFLKRVVDKSKLDTKYIPLQRAKKRGGGYTSDHFKDYLEVKVEGGDGGDGCISLLSTFKKEHAGPDGGDGGNGAHVVFQATKGKRSLCHVSPILRGQKGGRGRNKQCYGSNATHLIVQVPMGTLLKYEGKIVGSLDVEGAMFVAAKGGAGGKGNIFFSTDTEQKPEIAEAGGRGERLNYELELRTMADIGLIGFPNAGKSTLLRAVSRARPKVASYPFTTLNPHVGIVHYADFHQLAVADIPGLIAGAHLNKGLGYAFLRHVQRCSGLLYVLDASQPEPWRQLSVLREELGLYAKELPNRPHAVVANKIDLPAAQENLAELRRRVDLPVLGISAKHGERMNTLLALLRWLQERHQPELHELHADSWYEDVLEEEPRISEKGIAPISEDD